MGGNALEIKTRRILKDEYISLENKVISKLKERFSDVRSIPYYRSKADFGDMDIIVAKTGESNDVIKKYLLEELGSKEVQCNTDVLSFELEGFQIDLILTDPDKMDVARFYFSYNDLNNLVGRVANKFGLKFGHAGLIFVNRIQSGNITNRITLTKDPRKIYEFLGYDYDQYLKGFDKITDIFNFVIGGKYFDSSIFEYDQLNHQNKTRNKKRKTYRDFIEYISNLAVNYDFKSESEYIDYISNYFPEAEVKKQLKEFEALKEKQLLLKEKFSGKTVIKVIPDIKQEKIGGFINAFKNTKVNFDEYILSTDPALIENDILIFHKEQGFQL